MLLLFSKIVKLYYFLPTRILLININKAAVDGNELELKRRLQTNPILKLYGLENNLFEEFFFKLVLSKDPQPLIDIFKTHFLLGDIREHKKRFDLLNEILLE